MSNLKFDEFFYQFENHPTSTYWKAFEQNRNEAEKKYDNHIFCPLCRKAPLSIAKGGERKYFRVSPKDMNKHDPECSYKVEEASKKEVADFYADINTTDIRNRLIQCMNRMLKKDSLIHDVKQDNAINNTGNNFFNIETRSNKAKKYLPHKTLSTKPEEKDIGVCKIFYGKCFLSKAIWSNKKSKNTTKQQEHVDENEEPQTGCYIHVRNQDDFYICQIRISPRVYIFLERTIANIPGKEHKKLFYICFAGILEPKSNSHSCNLIDSRMLTIEEYS